jgi:Zn ribbon nucleic-acid-binding protein
VADLDPTFDRVRAPRPSELRGRDRAGKEALYSTAPSAPKEASVLVVCPKCDVETGLSVWESKRLLRPPLVALPHKREIWAKCPACNRRAWLHVRLGPSIKGLIRLP